MEGRGRRWPSQRVLRTSPAFFVLQLHALRHCRWTSGSPGSGVVLSTTSAGASWSSATLPTPMTGASDLSCDDAGVCVVVGQAGAGEDLGYSSDGGGSWTDSGTLFVSISQPVGVSCAGEGCMAAGPNEKEPTFQASTDGGAAWVEPAVLGPSTVNSLSCSSAQNCVAFLDGNSALTTTGVKGWIVSDLPSGMDQFSTPLSCPSSSECVGVSGSQIDVSHDGASSWQVVSLPGDDVAAVSCATGWSCTVVGVSIDGGQDDPAVWTSSDAGGTWTEHPLPVAGPQYPVRSLPSGVSCPTTDDCVVVFGNGEVARSTDGGTTWVPGTTQRMSPHCQRSRAPMPPRVMRLEWRRSPLLSAW